jgi:hypothetical protein
MHVAKHLAIPTERSACEPCRVIRYMYVDLEFKCSLDISWRLAFTCAYLHSSFWASEAGSYKRMTL